MYNQIVVVEGRHDEQKLKNIFPEIDCVVTEGSAISREKLHLIAEISKKKEVILFLDPDFPGKKITEEILKTKGNYKIAFLQKDKAISHNQRKVGVEHASEEAIKEALESLFTLSQENTNLITINDLMERKLINHPEAKKRREKLCKSLNIGLFNGKSLLKYLNLLGISLERIDNVIEKE